MSNPLRDKDLIQGLLKIRDKDPNAFMELMLRTLKSHPEFAVSDSAPLENKVRALTRLLQHFENMEKYEDCVFIADLKKQIEDGSKEQIPDPE